jgi:peptidoglycan hydrolase CwlO-like protein
MLTRTKVKGQRAKMFLSVFVFFLLATCYMLLTTVSAEPDCNNPGQGDFDFCLDKIQKEIDALKPAHEYNKQELAGLRTQIKSLEGRIAALTQQLVVTQQNIIAKDEDLAYAQEIFETKTNNHYKFLRLYDPILPFLSSGDASEAFREIAFRQKAAGEDIKTMEGYVTDLLQLKKDKEELERNQAGLAAVKSQVADRASFLEGEVEKTENYLTELSAKQQEILAAKSGSFTASVGDSELADDYNASIRGFRESAPAGSFAVFSFGAYTHRKGMSQYGARGRAENGQNFRQILSAYYGKEPVNKDTSGAISVAGVGSIDFETTYLYGIAEMPSSWNAEALKAQAVAARTYAYRYKVQGSTICTTEACQVYNSGKSANPPAAWRQAVDDTRGMALEDVVTYYSSTSGGYLTTMGWDTTDGGGGSNFINRAWESKGGSPWLYKAWYRQGYSASGATCGKGNPWLTNSELADIVNAALVLKSRDDGRITPITTECWGGNPYTHDELRNAASGYGGISTVSSVSVLQGTGNTNEVVINGSIRLNGEEFRKAFNLRAPGYLRIPQSGFAFYNIESK